MTAKVTAYYFFVFAHFFLASCVAFQRCVLALYRLGGFPTRLGKGTPAWAPFWAHGQVVVKCVSA